MRSVSIVQRVLPHYRVEFFDALSRRLLASEIELTVYYGAEKPGTVPRSVNPDARWATRVATRYFKLPRGELVWQSLPMSAKRADLIVVEQAVRLLNNYELLFRRRALGHKVAYWGHGKNFQARGQNRFVETIKQRLIGSVDWWFAYTDLSATEVVRAGFDREKVTVVNNSIDTTRLQQSLRDITEDMVNRERGRLDLKGDAIALYCGGMYTEKRLPFLIEAATKIREKLPGFDLLLVGDGPLAHHAIEASKKFPWIHYVGAAYGNDLALYLKMADVMMMPGLVGLAIVDSFVAGVPLATTNIDYHSPEIAYLTPGFNGLCSSDDSDEYSSMVIRFLCDPMERARISENCRETAKEINLSAMVDRFATGIVSCIG